ncbi:MAG: Rv1355c family protein [Sphingobacteriaceae bacterium]
MTTDPNTLSAVLNKKSVESELENTLIDPIIFRLIREDEKQSLNNLLEQKPYIKVYDTLHSQLRELVKSARPHLTLSESEISHAIKEQLGVTPPDVYGVWVYYPWNEKVVHILDEHEFVLLRTNRNRFKITEEESILLSSKKIGVIGLSVGQSVSLTLAIERGFGELRIADFDELELTNLNRLRSGVHNMGLKKTVIVAREIAEIDPFLKITCFHDGITKENLESFLLDNGKLDILIDECDGVDIKVNCRIVAKKHQIPVLMEASDRGTVDVERFDLQPERPLLHGYIQHLDISQFHTLKTNEQKLPYLLAFAGIETLSARMKASAVEIGQTISTWPQLASAVTMGGGVAADVCRRILLDQFHQSGRYFIDLEELIGDPKEDSPKFNYEVEQLTLDKMKAFAQRLQPDATAIAITDQFVIDALAQAALVAPSPGNNQPWKWLFDGKQLLLLHDIERSASYGDFDHMASYMSFGTAIENVTLKAIELGLTANVRLFPLKDEGNNVPVAVFTFTQAKEKIKDELVNYLGIRHTNRRKGNNELIDAAILAELERSILPVQGARLRFITNHEALQRVAEITGKAEKFRMFIPQGHFDLFEKEIRWTTESSETTRDGLDIRTLDLDIKDAIGFRVLKDVRAVKLVHQWKKGSVLEKTTRELVGTASVAGLITMPAFTPENCVGAGIAAQRLWLAAAKNNLAMQPVLAAILHFVRLKQGGGLHMPLDIQQSFELLYQEFIPLFALGKDEVPLFLFRLFIADEPEVKSLRLNVGDIFFQTGK